MGLGATVAGATRVHKDVKSAQAALLKSGFKSPNVDPYHFTGTSSTGEDHSAAHEGAGLTYQFLRSVGAIPYAEVIKGIRRAQFLEFCTPRQDDKQPGIRVRPWDMGDEMTKGEEKEAKEIMRVLLEADKGLDGYHTLANAIGPLVNDSYDLDQANFEVLHNRIGKPVAWKPVDAALMRLAKMPDEARSSGKWYPGPDKPHYVKVWEHDLAVAQEYLPHQMGWGVRNRRTMEAVQRYGHPELAMAAPIITDLLDAMTSNSVHFKTGVHSSAIVEVQSTMEGDAQWAFKNSLRSLLTGRLQARRLPIFFMKQNDKVQVHQLGQTMKDMEFANYVSFLLKVLFAVYRMDPAEANFVYGNEGQTNSLQGKGPAERIIYSQERGLKPDLKHVAWWFTHMIARPINPNFIVEFVGFDAPSDEQRIELAMKAMRTHLTPNEFRESEGLPRLENPAADAPLDQAYLAAMQGGDEGPEEAPEGFMEQGGGQEPIEKGLRMGSGRKAVDQWTTQLVEAASEARKQGRILVVGGESRGLYRFVPTPNRNGCKGMLVRDRWSEAA